MEHFFEFVDFSVLSSRMSNREYCAEHELIGGTKTWLFNMVGAGGEGQASKLPI